MKVKFEWNDSPDRIAKKKLGGQPGMLFLAATGEPFGGEADSLEAMLGKLEAR